jgi:hypothetical protein
MKDNRNSDAVFSKVLTVGPSRKALAGMASVLNIYNDLLPDFRHLASNSSKGFVAGVFALMSTMAKMPFERMKGRSILHLHVASGKSFVRKKWILRWGKFLGFKIIYHCHGGHTQEYFREIGIPKAKAILDKCSVIISLSKTWENYFDSTFHHPNIKIIYNPLVPVHMISHPALKTPLRLLFLGCLVDAKGIFDLLEVLAMNRNRWLGRVVLTIGGEGENERLRSYIRENKLEELVDFRGWVDGEQKERLFATNHVLILPSYVECLPMCILEAMGHGMAVISTPVGGIPEMIYPGENGILFKPGDKQAMSAAIDCYLLNPELIDRHGSGSLKQAPRFYPDKIKADLRKIYSSLL